MNKQFEDRVQSYLTQSSFCPKSFFVVLSAHHSSHHHEHSAQ